MWQSVRVCYAVTTHIAALTHLLLNHKDFLQNDGWLLYVCMVLLGRKGKQGT